MRALRGVGWFGLASMAMLACNALTGAGELFVGEEPATPESDTGTPHTDSGAPGDAADTTPVPPPSCACATAPPAGWTGPVALLESLGAGRACPTGLVATTTGGKDPDPPSPGCEPCACAPPTGSCTTASVRSFGGPLCGAPSCSTQTVTSTCTTATYCSPQTSFRATMTTDAGSCVPSGGTLRAASWKSSMTACAFEAPGSGTCPAGEVCAPKSAGAVDAKTCITKASDEPCPPGPYTERSIYYGALTDTRSCEACSCSAPNVTCSAPTITLYKDGACANALTTMTTETCKAYNAIMDPNGSVKITTPSTVTSGGCTPSGGAVTGTVTAEQPTTVCCLP